MQAFYQTLTPSASAFSNGYRKTHMCPKDLVSYRNISNILEEAPICSTN